MYLKLVLWSIENIFFVFYSYYLTFCILCTAFLRLSLFIYSLLIIGENFKIVYMYVLYLAIVLSVLLRYTDSDCPFGIFKLFLGSVALVRRFIGPKVRWSEGPLVRRFVSPKVR